MRLQAIGEQIGKLLKEDNCPFDKYPEIPWIAAYDMWNFISHEYANIDEAIVFDVIKEDLPTFGLPTIAVCTPCLILAPVS